jgi:heptosyltransferase I
MPPRDNASRTTAPESLCILRLSAIGDCCHTLPVVRTLQAAFPDTPVSWIIGTTEHSLLEGADGIEFITFDKSKGLTAALDVRRQLRGRRFSHLLNLHASMRANIVSAVVSARHRVGFDRARARDFQWLFTNERIPARSQQHVMDGLFGFAEYLGVTDRVKRWDIPVSDEDRESARQLRDAGRPLIVISPCTSQAKNQRNWSMANYLALVKRIRETWNARIVLTGASTALEKLYGDTIAADGGDDVINLIGKTSLKGLFAIIDEADLVICPDSGPAHMATAAGTRVVGLYASSNPLRTGPAHSLLYTVNRYPEAAEAEFGKPAEKVRWGRRVRNPDAMELITVDDVAEKIAAALKVSFASG